MLEQLRKRENTEKNKEFAFKLHEKKCYLERGTGEAAEDAR